MKEDKQDVCTYTIEREFLGLYSVEELLKRIIRSHIKPEQEKA